MLVRAGAGGRGQRVVEPEAARPDSSPAPGLTQPRDTRKRMTRGLAASEPSCSPRLHCGGALGAGVVKRRVKKGVDIPPSWRLESLHHPHRVVLGGGETMVLRRPLECPSAPAFELWTGNWAIATLLTGTPAVAARDFGPPARFASSAASPSGRPGGGGVSDQGRPQHRLTALHHKALRRGLAPAGTRDARTPPLSA